MGFGFNGPYSKKDFSFEFLWKMEDGSAESEKMKIEITNDQVVEGVVNIKFEDYGIPPAVVEEG